MNEIIAQDMEELFRRPTLDLSALKNSAIFIAGGNSMLGKYLVWLACYLNENHDYGISLYVLVRNLQKAEATFSEYAEKPYFNLIHQDICDFIPSDLVKGQLDYIFHFAGSASARFIAEDPVGIIRANTLGTMRVLDLAKETGAHVVFASTREVYGGMSEDITHIKEDDMGVLDPLVPRNSYPESKKMAEALSVAYSQQHNVPYTILRIAHTYGPGMEIVRDGRIMSDLIGFLVRKENIILNSDGMAQRGFCYISDCLDGILRAACSSETCQTFNLANEKDSRTILDTAQALVDIFPELSLEIMFAKADDSLAKGGYNPIPLVQMNTGKIEALGWKPEVSLEEGMERTVRSFW